MSNYYEDTMPLLTNKDEYLKYYFDESLPTFDKLNIIIKKGQPFQRQALIKNLIIFVKESLFKSLIQFIISDIGTWDSDTVLLFPQSLYLILINTDYIIDNELFNIIFRHMIDSVYVGDEKKRNEYTFYFNKVIEFYSISNPENLFHFFPYNINNDTIDFIVSLGKFGQTSINRRLCGYLSSSICRIININNSKTDKKILKNYLQQLYKRLSYLFWDGDKIIEIQMVRELLYIIPIFKDKMFSNEDINLAIESYINHDTDHIIQTMSIIALLKNLSHIYNQNSIINIMLNKIKEIIDDNDYEPLYKNTIIDILINQLHDIYTNIPEEIILNVFKIGIIQSYYKYDILTSTHIQNLDKVSFLIEQLFSDIKNGGESPVSANDTDNEKNELFELIKRQINFDELFIKIYNQIFFNEADGKSSERREYKNASNSNDINNNNLLEKTNNTNYLLEKKVKIIDYYSNLENIECMFNILTKNEITNTQNDNEYLKTILYLNLPNIFLNLSIRNNKTISDKIFNLFQKNNIILMLKIYSLNIDKMIIKKNSLYKLIVLLLKKNHEIIFTPTKHSNKNLYKDKEKDKENNNNNETINIYYKLLNTILSNIMILYQDNPNILTDNMHLMLGKLLKLLIPKFYKFFKNITYNVVNNIGSLNILTNNCIIDSPNSKECCKVCYYEKIFENIFNNFVSKIIKTNKLGDYVIREYVEALPYFILYSKNRNVYLDFVKNEIFNEKSFYKRKYSITFFNEFLKITSLDFFGKMNLINNFIALMKDKTNLISTNTIKLILTYNLKIISYSIPSFKKLCKILKEIYESNINSYNEDKKYFDSDKNIIINKIININNNLNYYYPNDELNAFKEKENILILKENTILKYEKNFEKNPKNNSSNSVGSTNINSNNQQANLLILHNSIKNNTNNILINSLPNNSSFTIFQSTKSNLLNSTLFNGHKLIKSVFPNTHSMNHFSLSQKDKSVRKSPWVEKSTPKTLNINSQHPAKEIFCCKNINNNNSKNYLPKLKGYKIDRKETNHLQNNLKNNDNTFNGNNQNNNNIRIQNLMEKSSDKTLLKPDLKKLSVNRERLPSAKLKIKNNYHILSNNNCNDEANIAIINGSLNSSKKNASPNYNSFKINNNVINSNNHRNKSNSNKHFYDIRPNSRTIKNKKEKNYNNKIYINANKYEDSNYASYK